MPGVKAFKKVNQNDKQASKMQDNLEQVFASFLKNPILDSVLLKGVILTTAVPNLIEHKLNREPQGWFIVRKRANSSIWDEQDNNTFKKKSIDFRCSADVVVDIFIF